MAGRKRRAPSHQDLAPGLSTAAASRRLVPMQNGQAIERYDTRFNNGEVLARLATPLKTHAAFNPVQSEALQLNVKLRRNHLLESN